MLDFSVVKLSHFLTKTYKIWHTDYFEYDALQGSLFYLITYKVKRQDRPVVVPGRPAGYPAGR